MSSADFRKQKKSIMDNVNHTIGDIHSGREEVTRVRYVVEHTSEILNDLDRQFCEKTGLTDVDVAFLFLATGRQIARQYFVHLHSTTFI